METKPCEQAPVLSCWWHSTFDDKCFNESKLSVEVDGEEEIVFLFTLFVFPASSLFFWRTAESYGSSLRLHLYLWANWLTDLELNAALKLFLMFAIISAQWMLRKLTEHIYTGYRQKCDRGVIYGVQVE